MIFYQCTVTPKIYDCAYKPYKSFWTLFFVFLIINKNMHCKRLVANSAPELFSGLQWALQNGQILKKQISMDKSLWQLSCYKKQLSADSKSKNEYYTLRLEYPAPSGQRMYLVKQHRFLKKKISFGDICLFVSEEHPISLEIYSGPLIDPSPELCSSKGLSKIASAINRYNRNVNHRKRISKLNLSLKMFLYEEKNFSMGRVFHLLYSNESILNAMGLTSHKVKFDFESYSVLEYRNKFSTFTKRFGLMFQNSISALFKDLPHKKLEISAVVSKYTQKAKNSIDSFDKKLQKGVFDRDFKNFESQAYSLVIYDLNQKLSLQKNLLFSLIEQKYRNQMNCESEPTTTDLDALLISYLYSLLEKYYSGVKVKRSAYENSLIRSYILKLKQRLINLSDRIVADPEILKILTTEELSKVKNDLKKKQLKFNSWFSSFQKIALSFPKSLEDSMRQFLIDYSSEQSYFLLFRQLGLRDERGRFVTRRFIQFLQYVGEKVECSYHSEQLKLPLFRAVRSQKLILI